jgi:hypothetical protein
MPPRLTPGVTILGLEWDEETGAFINVPVGRLLRCAPYPFTFENVHDGRTLHSMEGRGLGYDAAVLGLIASEGVKQIVDLSTFTGREKLRWIRLVDLVKRGQWSMAGGRLRVFHDYHRWLHWRPRYTVPAPPYPSALALDNYLVDLRDYAHANSIKVPILDRLGPDPQQPDLQAEAT